MRSLSLSLLSLLSSPGAIFSSHKRRLSPDSLRLSFSGRSPPITLSQQEEVEKVRAVTRKEDEILI